MRIPEKIRSAGVIHILGINGQEGRAVFDYLLSSGLDIVGHISVSKEDFFESFNSFSDAYTKEESSAMAEKFLASGKILFKSDYGNGIKEGDAVIVPQAYMRYPLNNSIIDMDKQGKIILIQAIEFAFSIAECNTIGVTGTAGKSTTTGLIKNMLEFSGKEFYFSGNDRENKWDMFELEKISRNSFAIFEISHRHLIDLKQSPDIAVLTNIFPHHLDDAGSFDKYIEIKKNIYRYQESGDFAVINQSLIDSEKIKEAGEIPSKILTFGGSKSDGRVEENCLVANFSDKEARVALPDFKAYGKHNFENALAGMLAGLCAGLPEEAIEKGIKKWTGLKYRQEIIGEWNGVRVINDGKSTDPLASIEAVKAIPEIGSLILGGVREGFTEGDFIPLGKAIAEKGIEQVFVFGSSKRAMAEDLVKAGVEANICTDIKDAVLKAVKKTASGKTLVFSPGCQSFDEFKDYRERAEIFNKEISRLFSGNK
ncbi:MAG: Mur ligase family protein [Candidatus Paceibacterota bacterium]